MMDCGENGVRCNFKIYEQKKVFEVDGDSHCRHDVRVRIECR